MPGPAHFLVTSERARQQRASESRALEMRKRRAAERERGAFVDRLASAHAERTGKPMTVARRDVEQVAISLARPMERDDEPTQTRARFAAPYRPPRKAT
jgi:hypothetical protein